MNPVIGVLYESDEWSDYKLAAELAEAFEAHAPSQAGKGAVRVELISMEREDAIEQALRCSLLVSRVFASAGFRGHQASLDRMPRLLAAIQQASIPIVNPARSHAFEVSKAGSTAALAAAGFATPAVYALGKPDELTPRQLFYPSIIKPDSGGRTFATAILADESDARVFLHDAPPIPFIVEEYLEPTAGFLTRVEIVGGTPTLVVKRSIADDGLSGYHRGSAYELYEDCPVEVREAARRAASTLDFFVGSFDLIETRDQAYFIDANSVSNVSEDCTELFHYDLMRAHAEAIAARYGALVGNGD